MPFVHHVSEVLIVQLISFVSSIEARCSEDGQEAGVIDTLLPPQKEWMHLKLQAQHRIKKKKETSNYVWCRGNLLVDGSVTVPLRHRLQHAAKEASVAMRLVFCAAGHSVNDSREDLESREVYQKTAMY